MKHANSQERTIYRSLAGRIQLGFYSGGARFPSVQEVSAHFQVSYCPAQRALKALERDGLIRLRRGKETIVLSRPYEDFLKTPGFRQRFLGMADLIEALELISPSICVQGLCAAAQTGCWEQALQNEPMPRKRLYLLFGASIRALGGRTVRSLYYDIGGYVESAFLDILCARNGAENACLDRLAEGMLSSLEDCRAGRPQAALARLEGMTQAFFGALKPYFREARPEPGVLQEPFVWEPRKGRTRYCDLIAIDLLRRIERGIYPAGIQLPGIAPLAQTYHVSEMTVRRTIAQLTKMEIVKTSNGVGTYVAQTGAREIQVKGLIKDEYFFDSLEALQLLSITCEAVLCYTFPYCPPARLEELKRAAALEGQHAAAVTLIGVCLQLVACDCPLAAVREIYSKIMLLLLGGSVLRLFHVEWEDAPDWPERSAALRRELRDGDARAFAADFRRVAEDSFRGMQKKLKELGILADR